MRTRKFGRSGLEISQVVLGGGWVGGIMIDPDDETKLEALRRCERAGVNWIDTAPTYGQGQSELALGRLLPELDSEPLLSTKVRLDTPRLDDIRGQVERSLHESLERLQCGSVELLQLHNPIAEETDDQRVSATEVLRDGGVADALEHVRGQGLCRQIGITALGEIEALLPVVGSARFDSAQVYYNLLNATAARGAPHGWSGHDFSGLIGACRDHGVAMMAIRVFAAGVIASDVRHGREVPVVRNSAPALEQQRARAVFDAVGEEQGTRAQVALRYALSNADLACAVVGIARLEYLDEALAAEAMGPLPEAVLAEIEKVQDRDFATA